MASHGFAPVAFLASFGDALLPEEFVGDVVGVAGPDAMRHHIVVYQIVQQENSSAEVANEPGWWNVLVVVEQIVEEEEGEYVEKNEYKHDE